MLLYGRYVDVVVLWRAAVSVPAVVGLISGLTMSGVRSCDTFRWIVVLDNNLSGI